MLGFVRSLFFYGEELLAPRPTPSWRATPCRLLVGNPEGKRPLGRPRHRWVDNIKMDLSGTGWNGMDWIDLAQDRDQWSALVNAVMNLRVHKTL
jgi:hypothetical protein